VKTLRERGYTVLEASDGIDALSVADAHEGEIHLLLTDVVMPQMGGKALAERMLRKRPALKILYTSGYTDNAIVHHGALDKGVALLQKPYTSLALTRRVRDVLDAPDSARE
jgi:CheY-like chemotaxis protein